MAKAKKTPAERMDRISEQLSRSTTALRKLLLSLEDEDKKQSPKWNWVDLPDGGAALLSEEGAVLLKTDRMPKRWVAEAIAAAPNLRMEKFSILFDRRYMKMAAPELLSWVDGTHHALLFLDLDGMKSINDRLGHDVGDEILQEYFACVAFVVRGVGEAYSWGGDEVVVLLPDHDQTRAEAVRDEIEAAVVKKCHQHPGIAGANLSVGVSGGVYVFDEEAESLDEAVTNADAEMYKIKQARKAAR